jgi:hypothetical protein
MGGAGKGGGGGGDMCENGAFGITQTAATPDTVTHDHLTGAGNTLSTATTLVMQINAGTPLSFMLPSDGAPDHVHVLTFTAQDYMTLRSGGMVSKMTGLDDSGHRHTYAIECMS